MRCERTLRPLESGELPPLGATSVLALIDLEPVTSGLRRILNAESTSDQVRFASLLLLSKTEVDLGAELDAIGGGSSGVR
jgi:G3E family GTPase